MDIDAVSKEIRRELLDVIEDRQRINASDFDETIYKILASRTIRAAPPGYVQVSNNLSHGSGWPFQPKPGP